jgi:restriction system protein
MPRSRPFWSGRSSRPFWARRAHGYRRASRRSYRSRRPRGSYRSRRSYGSLRSRRIRPGVRRGVANASTLVVLGFLAAVAINAFVREYPFISALLFVLVLAVATGAGTLWWIDRKRRQETYALRAREIESYYAMNAGEFEEALAFLCRRDGCRNAEVVGKAGDLGADVIAVTPQGERLVIQAKRYAPTNLVSGPDLQKFGGTCFQIHGAQVAAVVTTSGFTKQAREYAAHMNIRLFDHDALAGWASQTGPAPWTKQAAKGS